MPSFTQPPSGGKGPIRPPLRLVHPAPPSPPRRGRKPPFANDLWTAEEERKTLQRILSSVSLNDRERAIVERRLLADEPETLLEIGDDLGLSRERIRQLEVRIMDKLKAAARNMRRRSGVD